MSLAVLALGAVACGVSYDSFGEPTPVTKAAFVRDADQACAAAEVRFAQISEPSWRAGLELQAAYLRAQLPIYRGLLTELRELTPPPGDREQIEGLWEQLGVAIERISKAAQSAQTGDDVGYQTSGVGGFEQLMDVRWLMTKYGLESCQLGQSTGTDV